ncbi:MAG TPA: TadE/TadG family type IV pilus assembly protein [Longimicrobium sp.]
MNTACRLARAEQGQALVEFALVVPVLLLLVVGIFEFGRAWNAHQAVTDAAREGARAAVIADPLMTDDSVKAVVRNALARASLDGSRAEIELTGVGALTGEPARVVVRYPFHFGFLKPLGTVLGNGGTVTLGTAFVMRNE